MRIQNELTKPSNLCKGWFKGQIEGFVSYTCIPWETGRFSCKLMTAEEYRWGILWSGHIDKRPCWKLCGHIYWHKCPGVFRSRSFHVSFASGSCIIVFIPAHMIWVLTVNLAFWGHPESNDEWLFSYRVRTTLTR